MPPRVTQSAYPRPPITEAVIEIRIEEIDLARLQKASKRIKDEYASTIEQSRVEGKFDLANRSADFIDKGKQYRLTSNDQADICILNQVALIWSRLAPYEGWEPFFRRFSNQFPRVFKSLGNPSVARVGLRYINRIDVPRGSDRLFHHEDYLTYRIDAGPLFDPCTSFQWAISTHHPEHDLTVMVQSSTTQPEIPGTAAFMFDIDVAAEDTPPQDADGILAKLAHMRAMKNLVFETGITAKARDLYS